MGTLTMVAQSVSGHLVGADRAFESVSTDTRTLQPGQLFFALHGEHFDAASFVAEAGRRGAAGAVVEQRQSCDLSQVEVGDARQALGQWAKSWRARFSVAVIAVTGSNGKTTVKEMIASILTQHLGGGADLLVTEGNLNNEIGLPLTVLKLRDRHRIAVLEMGASHPKEIAYLVDIAAPGVGVVTNAGVAHLEGFGSKEAVAAAKGELFEGLSSDGIAILNRDDPFFETWRHQCVDATVHTFGLDDAADYRATDIRETVAGADCELRFNIRTGTIQSGNDSIKVCLPMAGSHNVRNALAATAAARAAGASWDAVRRGLAAMDNVSGRLRALSGAGGATLYDDSYNANPGSVRAAIEFLAAHAGQTWLVLGDMAELGTESLALHREMGTEAKNAGVSRLYCVGEQSRGAADGFGNGAEWFADIQSLADTLTGLPKDGVTILVKGSRCMGLEKLVAILETSSGKQG
jgi:UDP-N-acetylmuramoyl-tripeptide--D-alanyl-D-alanine ligase